MTRDRQRCPDLTFIYRGKECSSTTGYVPFIYRGKECSSTTGYVPFIYRGKGVTSNNTHLCTIPVAFMAFPKSLVTSVMLCPAHR